MKSAELIRPLAYYVTRTIHAPSNPPLGQHGKCSVLQFRAFGGIGTIIAGWLGRFGQGRRGREAVREFRALGDIATLNSYLFLVWLDWSPLRDSVLARMCSSVKEDFNGIGMGHHREELRKRLDRVLGQLDLGPEYVDRHRPDIREFGIDTKITKDQYRELKQVLLGVDRQAMDTQTRTSSRLTTLFDLFTSANTYRISLDIHGLTPWRKATNQCTLT